jgi:ABC-type uncharacterized transport system involved in gliding motility auxiliary subunit
MRQLKWFDILAPLGLVALGASLFMAGRLPGSPNYYALSGLALIVAHLILRWESIVALVGRRQLRHGGNMVALSLVVLAILVFVNLIVVSYVNRWDFTKEKLSELSEQSKKVVDGLKEDIQFVYFPNLQSADGQEQTTAVRDLLREYQARSRRVSLEVIDGMREPQKAREYQITSVPTLIIKRGQRQDRVVNTSEQDITNAMIRLTRNTARTVCFVEGEGERRADDASERGFSGIKTALEAGSYTVSTVSLFGEAKPLDTCTVLVIGGPETDLSADAVDRVRQFVDKGGKVLAMLEPDFKTTYPNLTALLKEWNVETAPDVLMQYGRSVRITSRGLEPVAQAQIVVGHYPSHEITKELDGYASVFWQARSVTPGPASNTKATAQPFLETTANAWADKDLTFKAPDRAKGRPGPVSFGVAVTLKSGQAPPAAAPDAQAAPPAEPETRLAVIGDSDFASNLALEAPGNRDLFLNTIAWLVKDTDLISIRPKTPGAQRLSILPGSFQYWGIVVFAMLILPGVFVVWGASVWWRRR